MKQALTIKQEKFCVEYLATGNASAAYRAAYVPKKSSAKTVNEAASRLLKNSKVAARIGEVRKPVMEAAQYDLKAAMKECEEAMAFAKEMKAPSAFVSAVQLRCKLNGHMVEERRNERSPFADYSEEELDRALAATKQAIAAAQGEGTG